MIIDFRALAVRVSRDVNEPGLPDEIEDACRKGLAFCTGDAHTRVVLRLMQRDGARYVLVWLGISHGTGALAKFNPVVSALTRAAGADWFEFCTTRRGFIRMADKLGFVRLPDDAQGRMWFRRNVR